MAADTDRATALKEFDETKAGVKGLADSGITSIPAIFHHPNLHLTPAASNISIPTIDLSLPRPMAVDLIRAASRDWGFFQLVNHGIPLSTIEATISAVRSFHELPTAVRSQHYTRTHVGGVSYYSNPDLLLSAAASWRDTLYVTFGPVRPELDRIPEVCRAEMVAWKQHAREVAREVMGMMCEGLGVGPGRLEEMTCLEGTGMVGNYYPPCPEPHRTLGVVDHTDPGVLTVLIQDQIGGLQVKKMINGDEYCWVDVNPVPGALVFNAGDLLQIISNDEYQSVQHRVVANSGENGRVSVAVFFSPGKREDSDIYGPLPELISVENPAKYCNLKMSELMGAFFNKELASKSILQQFKLP
ncbi:hypothetical protein J5N97_017373 [Dioscorea zingiberensis]|uniref:Fe2OG dioxygenase domain-containing protein n=1 Tax=Dioscorea zingiberensis TaxID=325984 RepID=A0A9D5HGH1_9LILI|nr:hypothetical protein J5N97_017373 [Dioscorea zingiberensis]